MKEIQLTASIDGHDFTVKREHATDFLCEDMRVKVSLRFRGREMAHQEFGKGVMDRFIKDLAPYGQPVETPKLVGRGLNVMLTPLPRNKRAKNPRATEVGAEGERRPAAGESPVRPEPDHHDDDEGGAEGAENAGDGAPGFGNNPFSGLGDKLGAA